MESLSSREWALILVTIAVLIDLGVFAWNGNWGAFWGVAIPFAILGGSLWRDRHR